MIYPVTTLSVGGSESLKKLKADALKSIREAVATKGGNPDAVTLNDIKLHRVVLKPVSMNSGGVEFEVFEAQDNERLHKKQFDTAEEMQIFLTGIMREIENNR